MHEEAGHLTKSACVAHLGVRAASSVLIGVANTLQGREPSNIDGKRQKIMKKSMWGNGLACVEDFDSDLMCARGFHLDLLDLEGLAWTPAHGGLALDHLSRSFRHEP